MAETFTLDDLTKGKETFTLRDVNPQPYQVPAGVRSLMNIGQAVTFGFGDELAGLVGLDKERYRQTVEQFRQEYPKSALLGTVSGSALLPFGAGKLAAESPYMAAAGVGGLSAALQAAGDAPDIRSIPGEAGKAGILGMAAAPLILGMAKPASSVLSALGTKLPGFGEDVAQNLARRRVAQAFERDMTTAEKVAKQMADLGAEARVADAAGENVRSLLDVTATLPGKTKEQAEALIRQRIATRPERLDPAVYAVGGGYGRAGDVSAALARQKLEQSRPLYNQLHQMDVAPSEKLMNSLRAAEQLGAFGMAEKLAIADEVPFTLSAIQQKLGEGKVSMRDADYIKRGIDSLIDGQTDAVTGKVTPLGRSLTQLKQRITSELDDLTVDSRTGVSLYKQARDAFAGPSALEGAITKGRAFWNDNAEGISGLMAGMSQSEKEAFRIGAAEALRQRIGSQSGQTQLLNMWKDRNMREKFKALLGDDVKYSDIEKIVRSEETLKRLEQVGRNSKTAAREAGAEDLTLSNAADIVNLGIQAKTGAWPTMLGGLSRYSSRLGTPEPVRDAIGRILMQQYSPAEMQALAKAQEAIRRSQSAASVGSGVAAGKGAKGYFD